MPGVTVRTATRSGPATGEAAGAGRYLVVGMTDRGPVDRAVRARSLAEWESIYGPATSYSLLHADVRLYFEEGGSEVWTARKVGDGATVGTATLLDDTTAPGLATLTVDAENPGAWSTRVSVGVEAGTIPGTRRLVTYLDGERRRTYDNLATREQAVAAAATDPLVRVRIAANATAFPQNLPRITVAPVALSAGTDDRATVVAANITDALSLLDQGLGPGMVAVPGYPAADVRLAVKAHVKATNRVAVFALGRTATYADALAAGPANQSNDGEGLLLHYPWLRVPAIGAGTQDVSGEGYVAAMRARAHRTAGGPTRAAFGELAVARYVLEPVVSLDRAQGDALDDVGVSVTRRIANTTRLYGYRSLSTDVANYSLLIGRDTLNVLAADALVQLEQYVGRTIDPHGHLYAEVAGTLKGIVAGFAKAGGLYALRAPNGEELDPGYGVDVGPAVNTTEVRQANRIAAVLAVRVSPVGSLIDLTIVKAGLTAAI